MILKGSQRGNGQNLAAHLLNVTDNEHVRLHELRGFVSDDLHGAFHEAEAISRGTRCRQYLFSLSLSPPEGAHVSAEDFAQTINRIESRMGFEGQPRAIVIHEKEGRRHAHCVWSRINPESMTAVHLSFFKRKLNGLSRELYLENGWKLPRGLENAAERNPTNFSLAEWQLAKRQGVDPRWLKTAMQECWDRSDEKKAFARSLEERGFFLARGDKRGFVVLDHRGDVWSLPRMLDAKTKEVRARLGSEDALSSVNATKAEIGRRMTPAMRRHIDEARGQFRERERTLSNFKSEMTQLHRKARVKLDRRLDAEWQEETRARAARLPRGLRGLWDRLTGKYKQIRTRNEAEGDATRQRHAAERQALIEKQLEQRAVLQDRVKDLRSQQANQLAELRRDLGTYRNFARPERGQGAHRKSSLGLKLTR